MEKVFRTLSLVGEGIAMDSESDWKNDATKNESHVKKLKDNLPRTLQLWYRAIPISQSGRHLANANFIKSFSQQYSIWTDLTIY